MPTHHWLFLLAIAPGCLPHGADPDRQAGDIRRPTGSPGDDPFAVSFQAGEIDDAGTYLGGTELMNLVPHAGRLFAGIGTWMDVPGDDPAPGPQILVLDSSNGRWRQDVAFSERIGDDNRFMRASSLREVTFTTDGAGNPLPVPVSLLIAGVDGTFQVGEPGGVFCRDDATDTWIDISPTQVRRFRALGFHRDRATGVDRVFVGATTSPTDDGPSGIYSGVFDPSQPGCGIRWNSAPELADFPGRVMAFVDAGGVLYFAAKPGLYARVIDGEQPVWKEVHHYDYDGVEERHNSGLRGLTALRRAHGDHILGTLEGEPGAVVRFGTCAPDDAGCEVAMTEEVSLGALIDQHWGEGNRRRYIISSYNDMPVVDDPATGTPLHLIGLQAHSKIDGMEASAWLATRARGGGYELHRVPSLPHPSLGDEPPLRAVRTIVMSPFSEDKGQVLFIGGYDASGMPAHETAWLYRVGLRTALEVDR